MTQDVVYTNTAEEAAAYQNLTTDEEREKFIEQLWLRRDATAGTPTNEFKEEHYRRIAYAIRRFADTGALPVPGWETPVEELTSSSVRPTRSRIILAGGLGCTASSITAAIR